MIFSIFVHYSSLAKLIRNIVRTGMAVKKKYHLTIFPAGCDMLCKEAMIKRMEITGFIKIALEIDEIVD